MRPLLFALIALVVGCQSCTTVLPPPPPVPPPAPEAGPPPAPMPEAGAPEAAPAPLDAAVEASPPAPACGTSATCADVCCHGRALGCDWAQPSPAGTACELLCEAYTDVKTPVLVRWNLATCVKATSCGQCR